MPATTAVARGQVDFTGTDVFRVDNGLLALRHGRTTRHDDVTGTGGLKQATLKACCSVPRFRLQTAVRSHARRLGTLFGIVRILSVTYRATAVVSGRLEYVGTAAYAVSGATVAVRAGMEWLGVTVLAVVAAVSGGTLRDLLLGKFPGLAGSRIHGNGPYGWRWDRGCDHR